MGITTRRYHARELERRTRIRALEGQARMLLNDLGEYGAWLEWTESRAIGPDEVADRWLHDVYRPTLARIGGAVGPGRDLVQAYCDVLEEKWFLSEGAGGDIGLAAAIDAYVAMGAPAPETGPGAGDEDADDDTDLHSDGAADVPAADMAPSER
jgi:hypothetical protein